MQKKVLITGVSGFVGSHLVSYLSSNKEYSLFGTFFSAKETTFNKDLTLTKVDLTNSNEVLSFLDSIKPDLVFHLAGLSAPSLSFKDPQKVITTNALVQINILEGLKNSNKDARILSVTSADIYGIVKKEDLPIDEETPFRPANPYAVSKITQDYLAFQYFTSYGLQIIRVRPFNHIGPGQSPDFVVSSFAKKIATIEKGKIEPVMLVGNLEAKRDFTDVRDIVTAYEQAINKGKAGEAYNIGSGVSHKISEILEKLISLSNVKITIEQDPKLLRPSDEPELVCDNRKFVNLTSWKPQISLEKSLKDTLDYWRNKV